MFETKTQLECLYKV